ncbi:NADP-dependent malic enzyme [Tissierella sp. Yu-01]|uniref:NAD(P)-dependent malic enzyme n=1 Tax=Tissierella sp. Yu-01 TaxID=3035694 RepID=UPI00240D80F5|nr:NADP-dependent malic enzyme [Tissierella sp. Yu-01]WFA08178.1 NADP-dependent malic enzyme [Tissierella sp. Yu-01]
MDYSKLSLEMHEKNKGKIEVISKIKIEDKDDLSTAYTPGVAEPCKEIHKDKTNAYRYTSKGNLIGVITDGSAVLGLGNIGGIAGMPVMEGKAILFKEFGNVDAVPIILDTQDTDEIVKTIINIAPTFGGINLEDISAPRCIEIENRLKEVLDIPVFHDDQHGTAIVVTAAIINALRVVNKKVEDVKVVINGSGAAGGAILKMLRAINISNIIVCDSKGIIYRGNPSNNWFKNELAEISNLENIQGTLEDAIVGADIFVGVSKGNVLTEEMVGKMNGDSIVLAMANPVPEIFPDEAKKAGARVIGTGRSDFPNQINNLLAFPGVFRGALDARASEINYDMNIAAAYAIANMVKADELGEEYIIPSALNKDVAVNVAKAVEKAARETGVARV